MATTDVEDENDNNILYDLTVHAEWKLENEIFRHAVGKQNVSAIGRLTSSTQRKGWTVLRNMGLPIHDGSMVAVLQDQCIELRSKRDDFGTVTNRVTIQRDNHPQWRRVVWSEDSSMLACSYSTGNVEVYDTVGTQLFTITGHESSQSYVTSADLSEAVAALIFTQTKLKDWPSELTVVKYHGKLSSYKVDRDKGFQLTREFLFNKHYPLGISCLEYHGEAGLLYVGGSGQGDEGVSTAHREGLTAWRLLSDYPHYKLVTDYSEDLNKAQCQSSFAKRLKLNMWARAGNLDGVFKMSLSPGGQHITSLHFSGKLSVWSAPGLTLLKSWEQVDQPYNEELSPELTENPQLRKQIKDLVNTKNLLDMNWWSDKAVILGRGTGAVTVSSIKTQANLLGNQPEWFEPAPRLSQVHNGRFLGLEVECRFPQKRRLLSSSDTEEEEESDEEEAGLVSKSWGVAKQCLHYVTDMERFKPPKKKPKLVNRTYRLVCLKSTTPEELFARKLENEEYGEAKLLAQRYGLDTDLVYQRQWRKSPVEIASIQDYLSRISKRSWVLHECMERMSDKIDAMKELLEFGLRGTDLPALIMIGKGEDKGRFLLCDPEDGLYEDVELDEFDPDYEEKREQLKQDRIDKLVEQVDFDNLTLEQRELCRARKKLLQYLYRLKTYECILGGVNASERYDLKFFETFRSQNIVQTAITYAQNSDWKALETLMTFHGQELLPHRLAILNNFPETTYPSEYKTLLPEISEGEVISWPVDSWSGCDWVDQEPCKSALALNIDDPGDYLYEELPHWTTYRGDLSASTLTDWYAYRAKEIEQLSRQADCALGLIKLGMERGVQGLDSLLDDMVTMEMLVYSCHIEESLTFKKLQEITDYEKLELIMSKSTSDQYSKNLRKWLVPFLRQCEKRSPGTYIILLRDYLITMARTDLTQPLQVFEASKTHLPSPVIPKQADLMNVAIDAVYSCQRDDQLSLALKILQCLPQKGYGAETKEIQKLHIEVDKLEHHLNAAKVLEENGIKKPIFYIKESQNDGDEAEQLMIKLTRMLGRREGVVSEAQWSKLHGEIMELQDKVYRCVSLALCHEIFVESLLCSNNASYIQLAGRMVERTESESHKPTPIIYNMQTRVPYHKAIKLVIEAAQEYFNSSANLTDSCIGLARSCLNLLQDNPTAIQEELDLINSLAVLDDFGVNVLPLQVRLCKDRLELVKKAVDNMPLAYKQQQKLLRLGHLLRVSSADMDSKDGKVLHLIAKAAFKSEDFQVAYGVCSELIDKCHGAAWDVCVDLSQHPAFHDVHAKMTLLSFAVTFCSLDMIEPILQAKALLETQVLFEGINSRVPDNVEETQSRISPFSAKAALQQTQTILSSTKQTTKAVLSTVTDSKWWHGTVNKLRQPTGRQISYDLTDRNKKMEHQSCHPFYEGFVKNCYSNVDEVDFRYLDSEPWSSMETQMGEKLLRTAMLEQMLTEGEQTQPATEVLLQLANECFTVDSTLSLAYLLALQDPLDADRCFTEHPITDTSLQLALYYYVLQLYAAVKPADLAHISPLYLKDPAMVMQKVTSLVCRKKEFDWPDNAIALVSKIKQYNEMLEDFRQAKVLSKLGRGIDTERFASDSEYKTETILGLAMSLEDNIYSISVSLAERYDIPLWQVYAAHVEFLFCESELDIDELQTRITKLGLLEELRSKPDEFCERMTTYVYPSLDGVNLLMLTYYYTTMQTCPKPLQGGLTADSHVKLLKKLRPVAAGLDYKELMESPGQVIDILSPCLTTASVNTFAKLAKLIPDGAGGTLDASIVYCTWAVKFFWEADGKKQPNTTSGWVHRYEASGELIQKLNPEHIPRFLQAIIYTEKTTQLLDTDCRHEICRRMLKFCRQQTGGKKKKNEEDLKASWDSTATVVNGYLQHLATLSDPVVMAMSESEVKRVQEYYTIYNLSMGSTEQVYQLLVSVVVEGELPLEGISEIIGAVKAPCSLRSLFRDALEHLLLCLSKKKGTVTLLTEVVPLTSIENIVKNIQEHIEEGGDLITADQLLSQLRPFCADATIDVQPRLDLLHILEKSFKLSDEDAVLLTLYRTQAVISEVWPQHKVLEEEINSQEVRHKLFSTLLKKSTDARGDNGGSRELAALCKMLKLWPPFTDTRDHERPWLTLLTAMVTTGCHSNITLALETLKSTDVNLSCKDVERLFKAMVKQKFNIEAVKFSLISAHKKLFSVAVETLSCLPQMEEDSELIDLVLKNHLVPQLVSTPHYPIIVQYLITNQEQESESADMSHDYRTIHRLAEELKEAGFEAEAGSLMFQVKSTPQVLQTFGSALGAISKWFK